MLTPMVQFFHLEKKRAVINKTNLITKQQFDQVFIIPAHVTAFTQMMQCINPKEILAPSSTANSSRVPMELEILHSYSEQDIMKVNYGLFA